MSHNWNCIVRRSFKLAVFSFFNLLCTLRYIPIISWDGNFCFLITGYYPMIWLYHTLFFHLSDEENLSSFQTTQRFAHSTSGVPASSSSWQSNITPHFSGTSYLPSTWIVPLPCSLVNPYSSFMPQLSGTFFMFPHLNSPRLLLTLLKLPFLLCKIDFS